MTFSEDEVFAIVEQLDEQCWQCFEGTITSPTNQPCDLCAGTGRLLTDAGEKLLDFIKRNWKRLEPQRTDQP
jgi:hypothetical protein